MLGQGGSGLEEYGEERGLGWIYLIKYFEVSAEGDFVPFEDYAAIDSLQVEFILNFFPNRNL